MSSVLVHFAVGPHGRSLTVELGPGQSAEFGRGTPEHAVPIRLDDPAIPRLAGEIQAAHDHWRLSNFSADRMYVVENPEGAGEYIRITPGRVAAPVPFEFSRVVLPTRGAPVTFQVTAPDHVFAAAPRGVPGAGAATVSPFSLDQRSRYFLVLVALCEARLRDQSSVAIPTTPQVVDRLREDPDCGGLTEQAVAFHIDYLAHHKLRVRSTASGSTLAATREAVVSVALRFGLVHEDHLALLPRRSPRMPARVS